jgi:hypothetical protein
VIDDALRGFKRAQLISAGAPFPWCGTTQINLYFVTSHIRRRTADPIWVTWRNDAYITAKSLSEGMPNDVQDLEKIA